MPDYYIYLYLAIGIGHVATYAIPTWNKQYARKIAHLTFRERTAKAYMKNMCTDDPSDILASTIFYILFWPIFAVAYFLVFALWLVELWIRPVSDNHSQNIETNENGN